jgi:hypothetical protein
MANTGRVNTKTQTDQSLARTIGVIILGLIVGIFYLTLSFSTGLTRLGKNLGWSWVSAGVAPAKSITAGLFSTTSSVQTTIFNNLWSGLIVAVLAYLVSLALLSVRHQRFDLVSSGFLFLIVGTAILQLVAWFFYIIFIVITWILLVLGFLFAKLGIFVGFIAGELGIFFSFIFHSAWWLFVLLLVVIGIWLAVKYREQILEVIMSVLIPIGVIALVIGGVYLLVKLLQFLVPIFVSIGKLLAVIIYFLYYVLIVLFLGYIVFGIGFLLVDQFKGAWKAGNGRRGVIVGSLAIGTSIALILVQSNLGNVAGFYPVVLQSFVVYNLKQISPPNFDISITLLIVGVSIVGVLRNLPYFREEPRFEEFRSALVFAVPLVLISLVLIAFLGNSDANN